MEIKVYEMQLRQHSREDVEEFDFDLNITPVSDTQPDLMLVVNRDQTHPLQETLLTQLIALEKAGIQPHTYRHDEDEVRIDLPGSLFNAEEWASFNCEERVSYDGVYRFARRLGRRIAVENEEVPGSSMEWPAKLTVFMDRLGALEMLSALQKASCSHEALVEIPLSGLLLEIGNPSEDDRATYPYKDMEFNRREFIRTFGWEEFQCDWSSICGIRRVAGN